MINIIFDVLGHLLFVGVLFVPSIYIASKEHKTTFREELLSDEDE